MLAHRSAAASEMICGAIEHVRREFVANVSHELRTTALSDQAHARKRCSISDDDPEGPHVSSCRRSRREVDRMIRLVEDLLELARSVNREDVCTLRPRGVRFHRRRDDRWSIRLRSARLQTEFRTRDLEAPVRGVHRWPTAIASRKSVSISVDNALRHTPAGGTVTVEIACEEGGRCALARA